MHFQSFKKLIFFMAAILSLALFAPEVQAQTTSSALLGDWVGSYEIGDASHFVEAHFEPGGDELLGSLDFRFDMTSATLAEGLTVSGDGVQFEVERDGGRLAFNGRIHTNQLSGTITQGSESGSFNLTRVQKLDKAIFAGYIGTYQLENELVLIRSVRDFGLYYAFYTEQQRDVRLYPLSDTTFFSELGDTIEMVRDDGGRAVGLIVQTADGESISAPRANPYQVEEVQYPHGDITIAGTLLLPNTSGPHPAIVIMQGTNPNNRDYFLYLGHYFAEAGIAALVYDKPGAFDSAHPSLGSFWENSVQDLADAALAGVHYLQSRPEINPQQVGIRTFSNSSWAGPLAAAQSEDVAFVLGTAVSGVAQRQADVFQEDLNNISFNDYPEWAANAAFEYLRFTREFSIFARELNLPIPPPTRDYYGQDFDPLTAWTNISQPTLVVNGQFDTLVDPVDAVARIEQTLAANGNPDYTLVVYPHADHGLLQTETGLRVETRGQRDRVFALGVMALQTEWVLARFDGQQIMTHAAHTVESPVPVQISAHFEANGRYELLPWYGKPAWQLFVLLLFVLVFGGAAVGLPIVALIRRAKRQVMVGNGRFTNSLIWVTSLLALWLITGLVLTWVNIVHLYTAVFFVFPPFLTSLPIFAALTAILLITVFGRLIHHWRSGQKSKMNVVFALTSLLFVWYLGYWHLLFG
ncbi:MAG: dienelactone hydrolase family protein [Anaerolineales bacterium]|nr:dienelactone hydrolase family protein [Anaerolineales bacterium]